MERDVEADVSLSTVTRKINSENQAVSLENKKREKKRIMPTSINHEHRNTGKMQLQLSLGSCS
jgi:hypothetical protein